jgi:hypothetical protein
VEPKIMFDCELCGGAYQMGPHVYEEHQLTHYQMWLCHRCYSMNWDGFAPHYESAFERHLASKAIPLPKRNAAGWYPR